MEPTSFFGKKILPVLTEIRKTEEMVKYDKVDGDEFITLAEKGFYLHSKNGTGVIFDCRIYITDTDDCLAASDFIRGKFSSVNSISDVEAMIGSCASEIRSIKIPNRPATLPGKLFIDGNHILKFFFDDVGGIKYFHINRRDLL